MPSSASQVEADLEIGDQIVYTLVPRMNEPLIIAGMALSILRDLMDKEGTNLKDRQTIAEAISEGLASEDDNCMKTATDKMGDIFGVDGRKNVKV